MVATMSLNAAASLILELFALQSLFLKFELLSHKVFFHLCNLPFLCFKTNKFIK